MHIKRSRIVSNVKLFHLSTVHVCPFQNILYLFHLKKRSIWLRIGCWPPPPVFGPVRNLVVIVCLQLSPSFYLLLGFIKISHEFIILEILTTRCKMYPTRRIKSKQEGGGVYFSSPLPKKETRFKYKYFRIFIYFFL